jgi:hypothetical protein
VTEIVRPLTDREQAVLRKYAERKAQAEEVLRDLCNAIAEEGQTVDWRQGVILEAEPEGEEPT